MTPGDALAGVLARVPWDRVRGAVGGRPRHPYPWAGLEREAAGRGDDGILVVGYGSLMNRDSALRTLADPGSLLGPVVAFRVRRVFDYRMPEATRARYPGGPAAAAALNVYPSDADADVVNGVLCRVPAAALPAFREREAGYDLVPVAVLPYPDLGGPPRVAHVLSCPAVSTDGLRRTAPDLTPHPDYAALCLAGARAVSDEFAALFLATTYLGDRATRYAPA